MQPCGTLYVIFWLVEFVLIIDTYCFLVFSWLRNHVCVIILKPSFCNKMLLSTVLNALFF